MRALLLVFLPLSIFAQTQFTTNELNNPKKNKKSLESHFSWHEVPVWNNPKNGGKIFEFGYGSGTFRKPPASAILSEIDTVQIIFTKYPNRRHKWVNNFHELLAQRVKSVLSLGPNFNAANVHWQAILQTDVPNEPIAKSRFHGARIVLKTQGTNSNPDLNPLATLEAYAKEIGGINDSTSFNIVKKSKLPPNSLLVIDWTASMHQYGLQVLMWHTINQNKSPFIGMVLFNDGNAKSDKEKVPGKTGGVYVSDLSSPAELVKIMRFVKQQGVGGDNQENDVEAIIQGLQEYPNAENVILIADNNSCMRDIQMSKKVTKPVYPVMCGVLGKVVNPQYVRLAYDSKGGVFTIEEQLQKIKLGVDQSTWINQKKFLRNEFGEFRLADPSLSIIKVNCP